MERTHRKGPAMATVAEEVTLQVVVEEVVGAARTSPSLGTPVWQPGQNRGAVTDASEKAPAMVAMAEEVTPEVVEVLEGMEMGEVGSGGLSAMLLWCSVKNIYLHAPENWVAS
eukprot:Hpha_TRINITY_DN808_c0_g1::TRINITY_DN808_c0_g1_i1::g.194889::m.194889